MVFRKAIAWWLLLLALSPCTAPFSTCDLSTFSPSHPAGGPPIGKFSPLAEMLLDGWLVHRQSPESPAAERARYVVSSQTAVVPHALGTHQDFCRTSSTVLA